MWENINRVEVGMRGRYPTKSMIVYNTYQRVCTINVDTATGEKILFGSYARLSKTQGGERLSKAKRLVIDSKVNEKFRKRILGSKVTGEDNRPQGYGIV